MATVRDTVKEFMEYYGEDVQNKTDCYHQIFLMLGGGYDYWVNGELENRFPPSTPKERTIDIDAVMAEPVDFSKRWVYPYTDSCQLFNTPDDIKPDWAEAVAECKAAIKLHPHGAGDYDEEPLDWSNVSQSSLKAVRDMLAKIDLP